MRGASRPRLLALALDPRTARSTRERNAARAHGLRAVIKAVNPGHELSLKTLIVRTGQAQPAS